MGHGKEDCGHGFLFDALQLYTGNLGSTDEEPRRPPRGCTQVHRVSRREAARLLVRVRRVGERHRPLPADSKEVRMCIVRPLAFVFGLIAVLPSSAVLAETYPSKPV